VKLKFFGANRQVTGSQHCLEAGGARILVDCGMYQERRIKDRNWEPFPIDPETIDAVLVTHSHVDHCGLLPRLVSQGFKGRILTTTASADLVELILYDSAHIQEEDAKYKQKRHRKEGRRPKRPAVALFSTKDVDRTVRCIEPIPYGQAARINHAVSVTFHDAGHILGSAIVEVNASEGGVERRFLFSGDLGQWDKPILRDPTLFDRADYLILESTYGDRDHPGRDDVETELANVVNETVAAGGNVVIPTFAVERSQELIYHIGRLLHDRRIQPIDVFLNSPMAVEATEIFRQNRDCYDEETWALIRAGEPPLKFPGLTMVRSEQESRNIRKHKGSAIIMATSGMCTAGRIKHHLRNNITRPESTILFVGFQSHGTLGRRIVEGETQVRIHGRDWPVRARVEQIHGFSGHADRTALLGWLKAFKQPPEHLFIVHGEEESSLSLAKEVQDQMNWNVSVPEYLDEVKLDARSC
jgi:metallo-beta-lactamase family protein